MESLNYYRVKFKIHRRGILLCSPFRINKNIDRLMELISSDNVMGFFRKETERNENFVLYSQIGIEFIFQWN